MDLEGTFIETDIVRFAVYIPEGLVYVVIIATEEFLGEGYLRFA